MEKLTKFYKMMYGSMDTLFVSRQEEQSHKHHSVLEGAHTLHQSSPSSSSSSQVSGYSSMSNLSQITSASREGRGQSLPKGLPPPSPPPSRTATTIGTPPVPTIMLSESPSKNLFFAKKPKKQSWPDESSSATATTSSHGEDSDSCYSDASYSLSFRTVNVFSEEMYTQHRKPPEAGSSSTLATYNQRQQPMAQRPTARPSPHLSLTKTLSQSSQSLPSLATANKSSHKSTFTDLLTRKNKNKKSKTNAKSTLEVDSSSRSNLKQHSASTSQLPSSSNQVNIGSVKDLVEVLIYQLQVLERCQSQLQVQNQNLERANKVYHQKLELAAKEMDLIKQKVAMLEGEIWRCLICQRDKIQLYSADVCIVALTCGHLFCVHCASVQRTKCPKCSQPFTIDRRIHL